MREVRRKATTPRPPVLRTFKRRPAPDPLAGLRALAAAPSPDARLVEACDRFMLLGEERTDLYRRTPAGFIERVREIGPEFQALEGEIAKLPARTALGRIAKATAALVMLKGKGPYLGIACAVMREFLAGAGQEAPAFGDAGD